MPAHFSNIIHVSDTHFRNEEHFSAPLTQIVDDFFNSLDFNDYSPENSLIVVTGDILSAKMSLTASGMKLLMYFLSSRPDYRMLVIPGNHDFNQVDGKSLGLLEALFSTDQFPHVTFLSKTGVYNVANVQFALLGLRDVFPPGSSNEQHVSIPFPCISENDKISAYIGISHVPLDSFGTLKSKDVLNSDHSLYLLGDIHIPGVHHVGLHKSNDRYYVYAGSLYQVSLNEDPFDHGYYNVSLHDGSFRIKRHVLPPRLLKLRFADYKTPLDLIATLASKDVPQDCAITVYGCPKEDVEELLQSYPNSKFVGYAPGSLEPECVAMEENMCLEGVSESDFDVLKNSLEAKFPVVKTFASTGAKTMHVEETYNGKIQLKSLEVTDIFCFKRLKIDFSAFPNGSYTCIVGRNGSGKTKFIESLVFALYGKTFIDKTRVNPPSNYILRRCPGDAKSAMKANTRVVFGSEEDGSYDITRRVSQNGAKGTTLNTQDPNKGVKRLGDYETFLHNAFLDYTDFFSKSGHEQASIILSRMETADIDVMSESLRERAQDLADQKRGLLMEQRAFEKVEQHSAEDLENVSAELKKIDLCIEDLGAKIRAKGDLAALGHKILDLTEEDITFISGKDYVLLKEVFRDMRGQDLGHNAEQMEPPRCVLEFWNKFRGVDEFRNIVEALVENFGLDNDVLRGIEAADNNAGYFLCKMRGLTAEDIVYMYENTDMFAKMRDIGFDKIDLSCSSKEDLMQVRQALCELEQRKEERQEIAGRLTQINLAKRRCVRDVENVATRIADTEKEINAVEGAKVYWADLVSEHLCAFVKGVNAGVNRLLEDAQAGVRVHVSIEAKKGRTKKFGEHEISWRFSTRLGESHESFKSLSGYQRTIVQFALGLVMRDLSPVAPAFIILDETFVYSDVENQSLLSFWLRRLAEHKSLSLVVVTHSELLMEHAHQCFNISELT